MSKQSIDLVYDARHGQLHEVDATYHVFEIVATHLFGGVQLVVVVIERVVANSFKI